MRKQNVPRIEYSVLDADNGGNNAEVQQNDNIPTNEQDCDIPLNSDIRDDADPEADNSIPISTAECAGEPTPYSFPQIM